MNCIHSGFANKIRAELKTSRHITVAVAEKNISSGFRCQGAKSSIYFRHGGLSGIVLGYRLDDREFESRQRLGNFLFTTASREDLWLIQPPTQWVPGALSMEVKREGREADHSPPSSAEVKECVELYLHSTKYVFMALCLVKHTVLIMKFLSM
jgi:hypothetical protein